MINDKKVLFSGMQATGNLTLGNYLGALKNWVTLSDEYECFYSVVDMHSITVRQDPATLRRRARALLILYIAAGLDPKERVRFRELIAALGKQKIVLLSTHIVSDVEKIADRILLMRCGKIIFDGPCLDIGEQLEDFYLEKFEEEDR